MPEPGDDISAKQLEQLLAEGRAQLVDVRQPHEHEAGHIAGSTLIELDRLPAEAEALDRDRPVVFYCRTGSRSVLATQAFSASGYEAYNLGGGIEAWLGEGGSIEPEDGSVVPPRLAG
jgi:rhodanese-related sulfurtransferase